MTYKKLQKVDDGRKIGFGLIYSSIIHSKMRSFRENFDEHIFECLQNTLQNIHYKTFKTGHVRGVAMGAGREERKNITIFFENS
jgi:hypothetical protein